MLNQDLNRNILFCIDDWINPSGNTGAYIMYQYTRISAILRKVPYIDSVEIDLNTISAKEDYYILSQLYNFWDVLSKCGRTGNIAFLYTYLYDLCQVFSRWYNVKENNIKNDDNLSRQKTKLMELICLKKYLKTGLYLLGIESPERM